MMRDLRLLNTLTRCGLNETESCVVEDLLNRGESTAGSISSRTGIKRATIYSALDQLEARRLLRRRRAGSVTRFALVAHASLVSELRAIWASKTSIVESATSALEGILTEYPGGSSHRIGGYEIVSYESRRKTEEFFMKTLKAGHYNSVFDIATFSSKRWRGLMLELLKVTAVTKPPIRELIVTSANHEWYTSRIRNANHEVKLVSSRGEMNSDFTVTQDAVILNSYEDGAEVSIQIRHSGYHSTMSRVFEALWQSANCL